MVRSWFDMTRDIIFISTIVMFRFKPQWTVCTQLKCYVVRTRGHCGPSCTTWEADLHWCKKYYNSSLMSINSFEEYHLLLEVIRTNENHMMCMNKFPYKVIFILPQVLQVGKHYQIKFIETIPTITNIHRQTTSVHTANSSPYMTQP